MARRTLDPIATRLPCGRTVLLPWLDTRIVGMDLLCTYLGCNQDTVRRMALAGAFRAPGCTTTRGRDTAYVPARIWSANHWTVDPAIAALLLGSAAPAHLAPPLALVGH